MSYNCPKCEPSEASRELKPVGWQDGRSGQQSMPRRIHLKGSTDATFMQKAGEKVNIGKFTTFEFLLVTVLRKKLEGDNSSDSYL